MENFNRTGHWLSIGDYNSVITDDGVSSKGVLAHHRSVGFSDWLFNQGLIDMGLGGFKFTWIRGLSCAAFRRARLDR